MAPGRTAPSKNRRPLSQGFFKSHEPLQRNANWTLTPARDNILIAYQNTVETITNVAPLQALRGAFH